MAFLRMLLKSKFFWAVVLVLLIFFTFKPQKELGPEIPLGKEGMTLLGSNLVGWEDRQPKWEVKAETIWRSKDGKTIIFQNISEATFYKRAEDGKREEEFFFSAPWARMEMRVNLLKVGGGIKGRIEKGDFETEEAEVNTETNDIKVPGYIIFSQDDFEIEAEQMNGNLDTEVLDFSGNVILRDGDYTARGTYLQYLGEEERYVLEEEIEVELEL